MSEHRRSGHRRNTGIAAAPVAAPLYEARFEHDACGVGFVADAGGRSRDRVLPLALAAAATADVAAPQPDRNHIVPVSMPTPEMGVPTLDRTWGSVPSG